MPTPNKNPKPTRRAVERRARRRVPESHESHEVQVCARCGATYLATRTAWPEPFDAYETLCPECHAPLEGSEQPLHLQGPFAHAMDAKD